MKGGPVNTWVRADWMTAVIIGAICWVGAGSRAMAQTVGPGEVIEAVGSGEINWTTGWIKAGGLGVPPPQAGPSQAKEMAERAAYIVALRNLAEIVNGVRVDAETVVENYFVKSDTIKTQVSGFIRGAQKVKTDVEPDGSVRMLVRMPLWGSDSLITAFSHEKAVRSQKVPSEPPTQGGMTGLVIDARGLGTKPAFFPLLLDEQGAVVYGPETVDQSIAEKEGLVEYHTLPKDANLSSLFGDHMSVIRPVRITAPPRQGPRPLKIKGFNKAGTLKTNILISSQDAKKIREDPNLMAALRRSKVVVVTDPMVGGIQGRLLQEDGLLAAGLVVPRP